MSFGLDNFDSPYVYRVLRPDEVPNVNLTCKDASSKRSLSKHVESGLWTPSKYISTAGSLEKAKKWLETANEQTSQIYGNTRTTIVRIDVAMIKSKYPQIAQLAIDLTREINRNRFLANDLQKNYARAYEEVVFVEYIPSEVITVEYKTDEIRDENHQLPIQSNDSFRNTNRSDDLSDDTITIDSVYSEAHNAHPYSPPMDMPSYDSNSIVSTTPSNHTMQSTEPLTTSYANDHLSDDTIDSVHSEVQNAHPYTPPMDIPSYDSNSIVSTTPSNHTIQSTQPLTTSYDNDHLSDDTIDSVHSEVQNAHPYTPPMDIPSYDSNSIVSTTPSNHTIQSTQPLTTSYDNDHLSDDTIDSVHSEVQNAHPYTPPMGIPSYDSNSIVSTTPSNHTIQSTQPLTTSYDNTVEKPPLSNLKWFIPQAVFLGVVIIVKLYKPYLKQYILGLSFRR